jgi:hypothetical protein
MSPLWSLFPPRCHFSDGQTRTNSESSFFAFLCFILPVGSTLKSQLTHRTGTVPVPLLCDALVLWVFLSVVSFLRGGVQVSGDESAEAAEAASSAFSRGSPETSNRKRERKDGEKGNVREEKVTE